MSSASSPPERRAPAIALTRRASREGTVTSTRWAPLVATLLRCRETRDASWVFSFAGSTAPHPILLRYRIIYHGCPYVKHNPVALEAERLLIRPVGASVRHQVPADAAGDPRRCRLDGVASQMSVPGRCLHLGVAEEFFRSWSGFRRGPMPGTQRHAGSRAGACPPARHAYGFSPSSVADRSWDCRSAHPGWHGGCRRSAESAPISPRRPERAAPSGVPSSSPGAASPAPPGRHGPSAG